MSFKNVVKGFKKVVRRALSALPESLRAPIFRRMVNLTLIADPRLSFEIARSKEDLEAAFKLLHEAYVEQNYMTPEESGLRITKYHALPTTTTLVAKWEGRVIATISIIRRTGLGLPLESIFKLEKLERQSRDIVEVSSLAIAKEFRGCNSMIFLLCKFMHDYCERYLSVDFLVIACLPSHATFYQDLMMFKPIEDRIVTSYAFVDKVKRVSGLYLDLRTAHNSLLQVYAGKPFARNLHAFFVQAKDPLFFKYPARQYYKAFDPVLTPEMLNYFFNLKSKTLATLSATELEQIRHQYESSPAHLAVFPKSTETAAMAPSEVRKARYRTRINGIAEESATRDAFMMTVVNVSRNGFQALTSRPLQAGQEIQVRLAVGAQEISRAVARVIWCKEQSRYGFHMDAPDSAWKNLCEAMEQEIRRPALGATL